MPVVSRLESLPVELLYEIHLFGLNHTFPCSSKHIYHVFKGVSSSYIAQYVVLRVHSTKGDESDIITRALRYPLCNQKVIETLLRRCFPDDKRWLIKCELPKRLFRKLNPKLGIQRSSDDPFPFLQYLLITPRLWPDPDSHGGYPLRRAVRARHEPLIQLLLNRGASPSCKQGSCIMIAIKQKDLRLVRMLIEREDKSGARGAGMDKQRRLGDRVAVNKEMLDLALRCDARDIAEYFTREKGIIPDLRTLLGI